jgi:hypothetical protein
MYTRTDQVRKVLAIRALLPLIAFVLGACSSPTDAPARVYQDIFDIEAPSAVLPADTLKVAFSYQIDCGPLPAVDVQIRDGAVTVAVWQLVPREPRICPAIFLSARTEIALPPEARGSGPTELRFRQASGADVVRIVLRSTASRVEP